MNKQMKRYLGQGPEDSQGSVLVEGVPPSQHMGVFTNSEPLGPCDFSDFCGRFITCAVC